MSSIDTNNQEEVDEGDEEEDRGAMKAAYSITDMLDALTDSDQEAFVDTRETQPVVDADSREGSPESSNFSVEKQRHCEISREGETWPSTVTPACVADDLSSSSDISPAVDPNSRNTTPEDSSASTAAIRVSTDIGGRFLVGGAGIATSGQFQDMPAVAESTIGHATNGDGYASLYYENIGEGSCDAEPFPEDIYENVHMPGKSKTLQSNDTNDIDGWSSDEFETYDASPEGTLEPEPAAAPRAPVVVLRAQPGAASKRASRSSASEIPQVLDKMIGRIGDKITSKLGKRESVESEDSMLLHVSLNMEKHPPAKLSAAPAGLSQLQMKRRHVLVSLVESERSYLEALRRLVDDYERPLLAAKPQVLPRAAVRTIFYKVDDILQCHNMFHIELAECVRLWDDREAIGNVFTASFSKAVVFESYSAFVNNFSVAMETTKKLARAKPAFADFLKDKLGTSADKMSLFGLMVKPVQRFPQFIMLLQDLLKYTPLEHADRLPLQMALTELETLTQRLNDTKRDSESRLQARQLLDALSGRHPLRHCATRYLVRQEDCLTMEVREGELRSKRRRLLLMDDLLVCVSVQAKESESGVTERLKYKWSVSPRDCDVIEPVVSPQYHVRCGSGQTTVTALKQAEKAVLQAENPHRAEVDDMLHDLPVIEQLGQLVGQLRMKYQGLNTSVINGLMRSLQISIQQKSAVNKSIIQLSIPAGKAGGRVRMYFQLQGRDVREDWLMELQNTKLALEPRNRPAWLEPEHETVPHFKQPLFMRPLLIDITNHDTRVECALSVVLPSGDLPGVGMQHLWVCSSDRSRDNPRGQVTVVSVHGNTPHVIESFRISDQPIVAAELVPGYSGQDEGEAARGERPEFYTEDTVWMGLQDNTIQIRGVVEEGRRAPLSTCSCDAPITCLRYSQHRLYVGLADGRVLIYARDLEGAWQLRSPRAVQLGAAPVTAILTTRDCALAACGACVHVITAPQFMVSRDNDDVTLTTFEVGSETEGSIQCMVQAGAGLFLAYQGRPTVRLFHLETMAHLQDVSVASVIQKLAQDKSVPASYVESLRDVSLTCMTAYKGMLWIGTSSGCILTLPLPRLEGVPQTKVRPTVSYHAHAGPVKFLVPVHCGRQPLYPEPLTDSATVPNSDPGVLSGEVSPGAVLTLDDPPPGETDVDAYQYTQSEEVAGGAMSCGEFGGSDLSMTRNLFSSTPDLRASGDGGVGAGVDYLSPLEDVRVLYGSLMRLNNDDYDAELLGGPAKRRRPHIPSLSTVTSQASKYGNRISQFVMNMQAPPPSPQSRYATLPVVKDDDSTTPTRGGGAGGGEIAADSMQFPVRRSETESSERSQRGGSAGEGSHSDTSSHSSSGASSQQHATPEAQLNNSRSAHAQSPQQTQQRVITQSVPVTLLNSTILSKSSLVLSGGQGHINWAAPLQQDLGVDDLCLLMWQHRQ